MKQNIFCKVVAFVCVVLCTTFFYIGCDNVTNTGIPNTGGGGRK